MADDQENTSDTAVRRRNRRRSQRQLDESAQNRREIIHQAMQLFARYGYTRTTLQGVAEQVGLTRTGVLHHFGSKEALFTEVLQAGRRWAEEQITIPARDGDGDGDVHGLGGLRATRNFLGRDDASGNLNARFVQVMQAEALYEDAPPDLLSFARVRPVKMREHIEQLLQEAHDKGEIGDVDVPAAAAMMTATINGLQMQRLLDPAIDTAAALGCLVGLLEAGRRPPA